MTRKTASPFIPAISDSFEKPGGVISKIDAAKHLSSILNGKLYTKVLSSTNHKGKSQNGRNLVEIWDHDLSQIEWLASEVEEVVKHLSVLLDEVYEAVAKASHEVAE